MSKEIAVIGGGAAGVMAALRGVLNNDKVLLFQGAAKEKKKSRGQWVAKVDNIPGYQQFKKGIINPNMETIKFIEAGPFAENFKRFPLTIVKAEKNNEGFLLEDNKGGTHQVSHVVMATGIMDVQPEIAGSIAPILPYANVQLVDYCIRCDGHHVYGKDTTVIGHTTSAVWVAVMLHERYNVPSMTILTNGQEPNFSEEVKELIELYNFKVETSAIESIEGNAKEHVLESFTLESGHVVKSQASFVSLGTIVYNKLATELGAEIDNRGYVLTNEKGETAVENLYVVGDLQAGKKKQIYTGWDSAVDALDDINSKIRKSRREELLAKRNN